MFGRNRQQPFEITEHPDVIKALNALADESYQRGFSDALAVAKDFRDEIASSWQGSYLDGVEQVIERLES